MKVMSEEVEEERKKEVVCEVRGLYLTSLTNKLEWIVEENHASNEKNFICKPYSYKAGKTHVNRQWQSYNNLFRGLKHNLEKKEKGDVMS